MQNVLQIYCLLNFHQYTTRMYFFIVIYKGKRCNCSKMTNNDTYSTQYNGNMIFNTMDYLQIKTPALVSQIYVYFKRP